MWASKVAAKAAGDENSLFFRSNVTRSLALERALPSPLCSWRRRAAA